MTIFRSAFELLGIVLLRFRPLSRIWAIFLILVNLASLLFLDTIYGQVALVAVSVGVAIMIGLHQRLGFVRLLGIGHILWIPMLFWMITEISSVAQGSWLSIWMGCLILFNGISLVIDTIDVARYLLGERQPHYRWD